MKRKNGFALLLSLIVTSILLTVGLGVSEIAFREILLSSFGNQSEIAFYAAETGLECALYWDKAIVNYTDDTGSGSVMDELDALSAFVSWSANPLGFCASTDLSSITKITDTVAPNNVANFELQNLSAGSCVEVEVKKETPPPPFSLPPGDFELAWAKTIITATGYNVDCSSSNPRKVGRVLELELNLN
jgi:hypothetical protein